MNTFRHNYDLVMGNDMKTIIAPRYFVIGGNLCFVHVVDFNCEYVRVYTRIRHISNVCIKVGFMGRHKTYVNKKGIYFNYSYWLNWHDKKTIRVYICG